MWAFGNIGLSYNDLLTCMLRLSYPSPGLPAVLHSSPATTTCTFFTVFFCCISIHVCTSVIPILLFLYLGHAMLYSYSCCIALLLFLFLCSSICLLCYYCSQTIITIILTIIISTQRDIRIKNTKLSRHSTAHLIMTKSKGPSLKLRSKLQPSFSTTQWQQLKLTHSWFSGQRCRASESS